MLSLQNEVKKIRFMWDRLKYMFTIKPQKYLNDLAHHHNLILKDLNSTQVKKEEKKVNVLLGPLVLKTCHIFI